MIIVLPYFPTGTMERVDEEGQIATAMVCKPMGCTFVHSTQRHLQDYSQQCLYVWVDQQN
jgi:hypothetical protein